VYVGVCARAYIHACLCYANVTCTYTAKSSAERHCPEKDYRINSSRIVNSSRIKAAFSHLVACRGNVCLYACRGNVCLYACRGNVCLYACRGNVCLYASMTRCVTLREYGSNSRERNDAQYIGATRYAHVTCMPELVMGG
jgi:hypothetical protein